MEFYFLIFGNLVGVVGYIIMVVDYIKGSVDTGISGFDMAKSITSNYQDINIVLANNLYISKYYLKRRVIRLSRKDYSFCSTFSLFVVTFLSCVSLLKNKYMERLEKIFPFVDYINKSSIIFIIISCFLYSKGDARIGIIIGMVILVIQYLYLQIIGDVLVLVKDKKIKLKEKMLQYLEHLYISNKLLFISSLILLLRFFVIIIL